MGMKEQEQERLLKANIQEQKKDQEQEQKPPTPEDSDLPFPSISIAHSPHPMVVLKCNSCGGDFKMEEYWYNLWMEKKEVNRKYRGIRCKWCGAYDSIERMDKVSG